MFLELIATLVAGFAGAGIVLLVNRTLGGRLPRWLMPVAAGATMIAVTVYSEYSWFSRTSGNLPKEFAVVEKVESRALYRPWTYLYPFVERFAAVDTGTVKTHPGQPGRKLADMYFFGRWAPVHKLPVLADCVAFERAALSDAVSFEKDGSVEGLDWLKVAQDDAIVTTICGAK
ncbi:MAG: hypothetical protein C0606_02115 [Hyphomicrobiales bacterium]|nr:MAG: hypothetical protein C0606_02115 [Hyphomicrobiales bacterium]